MEPVLSLTPDGKLYASLRGPDGSKWGLTLSANVGWVFLGPKDGDPRTTTMGSFNVAEEIERLKMLDSEI